jgi:hypothetical protein
MMRWTIALLAVPLSIALTVSAGAQPSNRPSPHAGTGMTNSAGALNVIYGHKQNLIDDFGADPNGIIDSAPAMTRVFALPGPVTVGVPCGTYLLNIAPLAAASASHIAFFNSSGLSLVGDGQGCVTFKFPVGTTMPANGTIFDFSGNASFPRFTVSDFTIDMANVNTSANGDAVIATVETVPTIRHVRVINQTVGVFSLALGWESQGFTVEDNYLGFTGTYNSANYGGLLVFSGGAGYQPKNGLIRHNTLIGAGMEIEASDTLIDGNICHGWPIQGQCINTAAAVDSFNVTVTNNIADGAGTPGTLECYELWASNSSVLNNQAMNCPGLGFFIGGQNNLVENNTVVGAGIATAIDGIGFSIGYLNATQNGNGSFFNGNTALDSGTGTLLYGFADQVSGNSTQCIALTQVCVAILGTNNFGGTLGPIDVVTAGDVYAVGGSTVVGGTSTGSANAQALASVTPPIIISTFAPGLTVSFTPGFSNTAAATLTVKTGIASSSVSPTAYTQPTKYTGAAAINKISGGSLVPLGGGELMIGVATSVSWNGTVWVWGPR